MTAAISVVIPTYNRRDYLMACLDSVAGAPLARRAVNFALQRKLVVIAVSENPEQAGGVNIDLQAETQALRSELILMACHCLY